jgi:hypothetical protein
MLYVYIDIYIRTFKFKFYQLKSFIYFKFSLSFCEVVCKKIIIFSIFARGIS